MRSAGAGMLRSARVVPASSTAQHRAVCPVKWFSSSLALSTLLPAALPARLKLSSPSLLTDLCVPASGPGSSPSLWLTTGMWEPRSSWGSVNPVPAGAGVLWEPPTAAGLARCCLGPLMAPGSVSGAPRAMGLSAPVPAQPSAVVPPSPELQGQSHRPTQCSAWEAPWMSLQTALHTSTCYRSL